MNLKTVFASFVALALVAGGCKKKDDPVIPNEEELITTFIYTLISHDHTDTVEMRFQDLDGEGGIAPIIIGGTLKAGTMYNCDIELLNEQANPAKDITKEVQAEAEEHQFFFAVANGLDAAVSYDDADQDSNPIGLKSVLNTNAISSGELTITLRHEPDKFAQGVANGDITNAGGETDIEVTFDVDII